MNDSNGLYNLIQKQSQLFKHGKLRAKKLKKINEIHFKILNQIDKAITNMQFNNEGIKQALFKCGEVEFDRYLRSKDK
ncbi:MAG: hypothetical protein ACFFC1_17540 [Promethearchaeota archaeon]